jgi:hypothetical protein
MSGHDLGKGALAGTVFTHDGMHLSFGDVEGEPLKDGFVTD